MKASPLRRLREERGFSQQQLADAVHPPTTQSQIDRLEKGERRLTEEWMKRLAKPLSVEPAMFMTTDFDEALEAINGDRPARTPPNRIEVQRKAKGWSLEQLAGAVKTTKQQIWKLENGKIKLTHAWMERISKALGCAIVDLLPATRELSRTPRAVENLDTQPLLQPVVIEELDVRATSGDGALADSERQEVIAEWQMPAEFVRSHTATPTERIKIIRVQGDSNIPDFLPGDPVVVDTEDRRPSPPGMFVLWDGLGLVMKRVEVIPNSAPLTVRLISQNPLYQTYERALADVHINGRVIGKWART